MRRRRGVFVTGTDTGIGKTVAACALLHALRREGIRAVGMKPVAAGCEMAAGVLQNDDALALARASAFAPDPDLLNPYRFAEPIAPHLAARDAGVRIDIAVIEQAFDALSAQSDFVVVEGAGGLLVPLGPNLSFADLAKTLGLPVVVVVGLRLGCLNHAMLTVEVLQRRGLPAAGWIANQVDAHMLRRDDNIEALKERVPLPFLGMIPYLVGAGPERCHDVLDPAPLKSWFTQHGPAPHS